MRPTPRRSTTIAAVLAAGLALGACDAIDGDLAPSAATGIGNGDVAASARNGAVVVTTDDLEAATASALGLDGPEELAAVEPSTVVAEQQGVLGVLVTSAVYGEAAERELDVAVTEEEVEEFLDGLIDQFGDQETLEAQVLASEGVAYDRWLLELPLRLLAPAVDEALQADGGGTTLSDWARRVMGEADPEVARRFGRWDPSGLSVVPADRAVQEPQDQS